MVRPPLRSSTSPAEVRSVADTPENARPAIVKSESAGGVPADAESRHARSMGLPRPNDVAADAVAAGGATVSATVVEPSDFSLVLVHAASDETHNITDAARVIAETIGSQCRMKCASQPPISVDRCAGQRVGFGHSGRLTSRPHRRPQSAPGAVHQVALSASVLCSRVACRVKGRSLSARVRAGRRHGAGQHQVTTEHATLASASFICLSLSGGADHRAVIGANEPAVHHLRRAAEVADRNEERYEHQNSQHARKR